MFREGFYKNITTVEGFIFTGCPIYIFLCKIKLIFMDTNKRFVSVKVHHSAYSFLFLFVIKITNSFIPSNPFTVNGVTTLHRVKPIKKGRSHVEIFEIFNITIAPLTGHCCRVASKLSTCPVQPAYLGWMIAMYYFMRAYLGQLDQLKPIHLHVISQPMSSNLKLRFGYV